MKLSIMAQSHEKSRIWLLDSLRGLAILVMLIYHFAYDYMAILGVNLPFFQSDFFDGVRLLFGLVFIVISGICTNFSKRLLKRGFITGFAALVITLITYLILPEEFIVFGILHFFALSFIIYALIGKYLQKIPLVLSLFLWSGLYIITYIYTNPSPPVETNLLFIFGVVNPSFYSADYYPLFPWFFAFLFGTRIGELIKNKNLPKWFYQFKEPAFSFLGRYSFLIYLLHQPIFYGGLVLFSILR